MRAVKSVSIDSERRVIITFLDGSTETLYPNSIWCDLEALRELIKDLLEEKADAVVQTINNVTVASFEDGADEALIRKLLVAIDPIQEGTGDPSPENVRPITGRTGLNVVRTGKNLLPSHATSGTGNGLTWTVAQDGTVVVNGTASSTVLINSSFSDWMWDGVTSCWLSGCPDGGSDTTYALRIGGSLATQFSIACYDSVGCLLRRGGNGSISNEPIRFQIIIRPGTNCNNLTFKPQLEYGSAKSNYEPYKGTEVSVNWETEAGTVYGGTLDVVSGKLTVDSAYIASYNGETLPSTWISDRDVYAEGTTPTTGAQVVYKLAEPVEYQLTSQEITTFLGTNNIWADSGDILELEYVADTKLYIGESQSGTLGSGRQTISNTDLQPVSEKTREELSEAYKTETEEKETQTETEDERGE